MIVLDNKNPDKCTFGVCIEFFEDGSKITRRYYKTIDDYLLIFGFGKIKNWKQGFSINELRGFKRESQIPKVWSYKDIK